MLRVSLRHSQRRACLPGTHSRRLSSRKPFDPLRILFCGSDEFSVASLEALHAEHKARPDLVASLHVISKKPKRTGRGLKILREVPITSLARRLSLPLHQIDTFRGWQFPVTDHGQINLIIAVSFGLLVPRRLLDAAQYGGLNVHPSMLPEFVEIPQKSHDSTDDSSLRGAAPLVHTLLQRSDHTGISLQTLHPTKLDHGTILAQTPYPGLRHNAQSVLELNSFLAPKGADMLVNGIRDGVFVLPLEDVGWCKDERNESIRAAPKLGTEDRRIQWQSWTAEDILLKNRILGPLFNTVPASPESREPERRIIWTSGFQKSSLDPRLDRIPGRPRLVKMTDSDSMVLFPTCDGQLLQASSAKLEGQKEEDVFKTLRRARLFEALNGTSHSLR